MIRRRGENVDGLHDGGKNSMVSSIEPVFPTCARGWPPASYHRRTGDEKSGAVYLSLGKSATRFRRRGKRCVRDYDTIEGTMPDCSIPACNFQESAQCMMS